ncbi:sugar kinase [Pseudomonas sp.]|uniref:sugar kinase n=1 Tax=Pseudomonas sp. TaxID=306 RepID=UPI0028A741DA|nr:sugar kinase [Pseudomonas sp.]
MREHDVLCFGETMAMFVAEQAGDLAQVGAFSKRIAGADSNVAIGLARLGFAVRWLSRVGDDSLGRFVLASLRREGLDCGSVEIDAGCPTGFQLKSRCDDGSDPAVEYFRAGSAASHMSTALSSSCRALSHALIDSMRAAKRTVSFDPNLRPSLWPDQPSMVREINALAVKAQWVLPGLEEGRLLTGQRTPADIAAFYLDQGVEHVVIKLGDTGAYYRNQREAGQVAAVPVANVVDTVGAGDAFAVGVVSALLEGRALVEAVARGNWCGSRAVQSRGDMEGLPSRSELQAHELRRSA